MWTWFRAVRSFESYARISCIWKRLAQDSLQVRFWNNPKLLQVPNSSQNALHLPHPCFIIVIFQSKLFLIFSLAVNDLQRHFLPFTCTVVSTIFSFQLWFTTFKFEKFVAWIENWCVNFCHKYIWEWPVQVMAEPKSVLLSGILGFCLHFSCELLSNKYPHFVNGCMLLLGIMNFVLMQILQGWRWEITGSLGNVKFQNLIEIV